MTVAVIDSGVQATVTDLSGLVLNGFDYYVPERLGKLDDYGHGTNVASILGAHANNNVHIAGYNQTVRILPVKVLNSTGQATNSTVTQGIIDAADAGAKVLNLSLGGSTYSPAMEMAVAYAREEGAVVIAAAGNDKLEGNPVMYPAAYPGVIAVGATNLNDGSGAFSNTGPYLDLAAPGVGILVVGPGDGLFIGDGTSFAAPYVAGLAAQLLAVNPALTPDQVENLLTSTATDLGPVGWDETFGHGIINPLEALCGVGACEVVTAPSAPTSPTAVPGNQQVTVSWDAPVNNGGSPVTGYTVTVSPGGQVVDVGAGTTSTTVTGLSNGTAYTFAIRAVNSAGESPAVNVQATPRTVPGAPQNVNASPGNGQVTVSWAAPASNGGSPITGYTVTTSPGGQSVSVGAGVTSTPVTGLTNGTTYTFEVGASNAAGQGAAASVQATPVAVPGVPGNPTATPGDGQVTVSWTAPDPGWSPITGYNVTTTAGGQVQEVGPDVTSTITGLTNCTTCSFAIRAVNAVDQSTAVNVQDTPRTVPGDPGDVTAVPGDQQGVVSWTTPASDGGAGITGYTVAASPGRQSLTVGAAATSAVVTGLTNGTAYTFEVRATNAAGQGPTATTTPGHPDALVVAEKVVRLAGANGYAVAAEITRQFPTGVPVLYVASGQNFPKVLTGAVLDGSGGAPVFPSVPPAS